MNTSSSFMKRISKGWVFFLSAAVVAGLALRLTFKDDMEWKEDEQYHYLKSQTVGITEPWPWIGIPSGVYLPNPGMSVWIFAWVSRVFRASSPTAVADALAIFSVVGMLGALLLAVRFIGTQREREPWLWAVALGMVNPFHVLYERKLWPEGFLPFFATLALMGWWRRDLRRGAFLWGFMGALVGQIHMSGFFFAAAIFFWTILFGKRLRNALPNEPGAAAPTRWGAWFIGAAIGAAPLVPWALHVLANPVGGRMSGGWGEAIQLKYWVFWITDALGLTLGNPLGLLRSQSTLGQIADFVRYPILGGQATYLNGLAHAVLAALAFWVLLNGFRWLIQKRPKFGAPRPAWTWIGLDSQTSFVQNSLLIGAGLLLTLTCVNIRRYYMVVNFPFEFLFLARIVLLLPAARARWVLGAIWACQLVISAHLVGYVHVNEGAEQGDYGKAYHVIIRENPVPSLR